MYLAELGQHVREQRMARGWTQSELARLAGLTRETVNRLESGRCADLGVAKLGSLLALVGLELAVQERSAKPRPDFVQRATLAANVRNRDRLHADELVGALANGRTRPERRALVRAALEEVSEATRAGLVQQVSRLVRATPKRIETNATALVADDPP